MASSPFGPFKHGQIIKGIKGIDPSVFIDEDGQGYLFWGQGYAKGAKLTPDLMHIEGPVHDSLLTYEKDAFNEGSSIRKRNGIYYYVYASHIRHGESNCATLCYATATKPLGPYTYRGVIIDNWGSGKNLVNNHGCIQQINGRWYVFYHRPTHGSQTMRKACVEPIYFNADGSIDKVEMTTQGAAGPINPLQRMDAARACLMHGSVMVNLRRPKNDIPVEYLSDIQDGDDAYWKYFDFDQKNVKTFTCKLWGPNQPATIEIHLDSAKGRLIGKLNVAPMKGETAFTIHKTSVKAVLGKHAVVLVFKGHGQSGSHANAQAEPGSSLLSLEWFVFGKD
ncbi:hypothetical protein GCM10027566_00460 [Arachidicoccus ginsenosidivorans]|uniref:family 43 glycosylhydrolase n=1 Tax=Arachidicoccus ginsenosidivorans TaxID=496057 RepID=UPI001CEFA2E5|nr:family 43 glycosylhydrolase [Arachidicoccus ginsenosidivorans]